MLRELGHNEAATVFTVISRAMLACDVRGLSEKARVALLADRSYLVSRILGDYLVAHGNIPVKVRNLSSQVLLSWLINEEGRWWLLSMLPAEWRAVFCDRSRSTDCVELAFSTVVMLCSFKPAKNVLKSCLNNLMFALEIRSTPEEDKGFSTATSIGGITTYHSRPQHSEAAMHGWNSGDSNAMVLKGRWSELVRYKAGSAAVATADRADKLAPTIRQCNMAKAFKGLLGAAAQAGKQGQQGGDEV